MGTVLHFRTIRPRSRGFRIQGGQGRGGLGYRSTVQAFPYC
jgi:hypothetical protein